MSIRATITAFGGIRPMAGKLGHRSHTTVQGWWDRAMIPAQRQREVLDAANRLSIEVTSEDLIPAAAHCTLCNEARADGEIAACTATDCPSRQREAA